MLENRFNAIDEVGLTNVVTGQVHRHAHWLEAGILPCPGLGAGCFKDPFAEREDQAALFGDTDNLTRRNQFAVTVVPAQQGFNTGDFTGNQVDLRLVVLL